MRTGCMCPQLLLLSRRLMHCPAELNPWQVMSPALPPFSAAELLARRTPGFSGAELANLVNEAALLAARYDRDSITTQVGVCVWWRVEGERATVFLKGALAARYDCNAITTQMWGGCEVCESLCLRQAHLVHLVHLACGSHGSPSSAITRSSATPSAPHPPAAAG